jgi:hypothetical protein
MVLTVSFALSSVTGLFCHRRLRTSVVSAPGRADTTSANLTPASGRQDHTTSPYATTSLVSVPDIAHRSYRPALRFRCAQNVAASTASHPASVTIAIRPSVGWDGERSRDDLGWVETRIFLQRGIDTPANKPPVGQITQPVGRAGPAALCTNSVGRNFLTRHFLPGAGGIKPMQARPHKTYRRPRANHSGQSPVSIESKRGSGFLI